MPTPQKTPTKQHTPIKAWVRPPMGATPRKTPRRTPQKVAVNSNGEEGIQVAIRMRPLNTNEGNHCRVWKVLPKYLSVTQTTVEGQPLAERITGRTFFTFDKTFGEDVSTSQVYDYVAKGIISSVVTGLNGTIFAYGQTSSGKTYTMQGSGTIEEGSATSGGIVHMAAADIFQHIRDTPQREFLVRTSFLEIYNEEVRDLLSDNSKVKIREDPRLGVFVPAKEEIVTGFDSLLQILIQGEKSRTFASTAMNERSSRSHTIFRITIESRQKTLDTENVDDNSTMTGSDAAVLISVLNLVDLAGSESVRHTGASGDRQKEGGMINQSLLTLSRVIVALGNPSTAHVNFRDSKLTRILQPSLSGNARMAVICCATPSELYLEETRSTLQFASRAKLVKTNAQVNEVLDDQSLIRRLQKELAEARKHGGDSEHLAALEEKAATAGTEARLLEDRLRRLQASILNGGALFSENTMVENESVARDDRKRRLSDGGLIVASTPGKLSGVSDEKAAARTSPRNAKKLKVVAVQSISPGSELSLVRAALLSKSRSTALLLSKLENIHGICREKQLELESMNGSCDSLRMERDVSAELVSSMSSAIEALREELSVALTAHEKDLAEKDNSIQHTVAKLDQEIADRRTLETALDNLQQDKITLQKDVVAAREAHDEEKSLLEKQIDELSRNLDSLCEQLSLLQEALTISRQEQTEEFAKNESLQREFDALKDERVRSAFEYAQLKSQVESLRKERENDKVLLAESSGKTELLLSMLRETEVEKDDAVDECSDLKAEIESTRHELESAKASLETSSKELAEMRTRADELEIQNSLMSGGLEQSKQLLDDATTTICSKQELLEVKDVSLKALEQEAEGLRAVVTKQKSELEAASVTQTKLSETVCLLQQRLDESAASLETTTHAFLEAEQQGMELRNLVDELKAILATVNNNCKELNAEIESAKADLKDEQESRSQLQAVIAELSVERDDALAEFASLKVVLEEGRQRLSQHESEKRELSIQLEHAREEVAQLELEVSSVGERNAELKKLLSSSEARAASLSSELDTASSKLEELDALRGEVQEKEDSITLQSEQLSDLLLKLNDALSEKQALESALAALKDNAAQVSIQLNQLLTALAMMEAEKATFQCQLETQQSVIASLRQTESDLRGSLANKEQELAGAESKVAELLGDLQMAKCDVSEYKQSLLETHDLLESSKAREFAMRQRVNDVEDELASKTSMLAQSTSVDDRHIEQIQSLEERVEGLLKQNAILQQSRVDAGPRMEFMENKMLQGEAENAELKRLLMASNEAVAGREGTIAQQKKDLANLQRLLQQQESDFIAAKEQNGSSMISSERLEAATLENDALKSQLDIARSQHKQLVADWKRKLRLQEQSLAEESDKRMRQMLDELRAKTATLEKSETEARAARERNEELRGIRQADLQKTLALEKRIRELEDSLLQTRGLNSDIRSLSLDLEMERKGQKELKLTIGKLKSENQQLRSRLASIPDIENWVRPEVHEELRSRLSMLSAEMQSKDGRIQRLEANKLTKGQIANITKMKESNTKMQAKISKLEGEIRALATGKEQYSAEIESLRTQFQEASSSDSESSKLRFENKALESKLRKYATHAQELEDERAKIIRALQSVHQSTENGDVVKAVVELCDKAACYEEERDAVSNLASEQPFNAELEELKRENVQLKSQVASANHDTSRKLSLLERENQHLRAERDVARTAAKENGKLEREVLQLYNDLDQQKQKYQRTKAELIALQNQKSTDDLTFEIEQVKSRAKHQSTPATASKENKRNAASVSKSERLPFQWQA